MEDKYLFDVLDCIDEGLINSSITQTLQKKRVSIVPKLSVIAACLVLIVASAVLIPYSKKEPPNDIPPVVHTIGGEESTDTAEREETSANESSDSNDTESMTSDEPITDTEEPTEITTDDPTSESTEEPTSIPTEAPTEEPTESQTEAPTEEPTEEPTEPPTESQTEAPTEEPTEEPTEPPTESQTESPTEEPTGTETDEPIHGVDPGPAWNYFRSIDEFINWLKTTEIEPSTEWYDYIKCIRDKGYVPIVRSKSPVSEVGRISCQSWLPLNVEYRFWEDNDPCAIISLSLKDDVEKIEEELARWAEAYNNRYMSMYEDCEEVLYTKSEVMFQGEEITLYYSNGGEVTPKSDRDKFLIQPKALFAYNDYIVYIKCSVELVGSPWDNSFLDNYEFTLLPIDPR